MNDIITVSQFVDKLIRENPKGQNIDQKKGIRDLITIHATNYCKDINNVTTSEAEYLKQTYEEINCSVSQYFTIPATTMRNMAEKMGYKVISTADICPIVKETVYKVAVYKKGELLGSLCVRDSDFNNKMLKETVALDTLKMKRASYIKSLEAIDKLLDNPIALAYGSALLNKQEQILKQIDAVDSSISSKATLVWMSFPMAMKIKRVDSIAIRHIIAEFRMVYDKDEDDDIQEEKEVNKQKK